jgi:hypothetical protein
VAQLVIPLAFLATPALIAVVLLVWGSASLLLDVWRCSHPHDKAGSGRRLVAAPSVADEAERWLKTQR